MDFFHFSNCNVVTVVDNTVKSVMGSVKVFLWISKLVVLIGCFLKAAEVYFHVFDKPNEYLNVRTFIDKNAQNVLTLYSVSFSIFLRKLSVWRAQIAVPSLHGYIYIYIKVMGLFHLSFSTTNTIQTGSSVLFCFTQFHSFPGMFLSHTYLPATALFTHTNTHTDLGPHYAGMYSISLDCVSVWRPGCWTVAK